MILYLYVQSETFDLKAIESIVVVTGGLGKWGAERG